MSKEIKHFIKNEGTEKLDETSNMELEINSLEDELINMDKNWELAYYYAKEYEKKVEEAKTENKENLNELKVKLHDIKEKLKEFGDKSRELRKIIDEIKEKQSILIKESTKEENLKIN